MTRMQIIGYRSVLKGAIRLNTDGAEVILDLTSAKKILELLDQLVELTPEEEPFDFSTLACMGPQT